MHTHIQVDWPLLFFNPLSKICFLNWFEREKERGGDIDVIQKHQSVAFHTRPDCESNLPRQSGMALIFIPLLTPCVLVLPHGILFYLFLLFLHLSQMRTPYSRLCLRTMLHLTTLSSMMEKKSSKLRSLVFLWEQRNGTEGLWVEELHYIFFSKVFSCCM